MSQAKIKLLIVDDEKDICNFVKLLFRKKKLSVYSALSGNQAVRLAKKIKPDIALLDIHLKKGMNGIEVLQKLKELMPACRCVIVTWDEAQEKIKQARALGAAGYLTKPLTANQLLKVVSRIAKNIGQGGK